MHVIQSQLINYSFDEQVQKKIKLIRWWVLVNANGEEEAAAFNQQQQAIFMNFMDDHPANFPVDKREIFDSFSLKPPSLLYEDQESDAEKPCILLIRAQAQNTVSGICRRMDIVLQNNELPIKLPFDLAGEIIMERA